jgi:hypothetical protein
MYSRNRTRIWRAAVEDFGDFEERNASAQNRRRTTVTNFSSKADELGRSALGLRPAVYVGGELADEFVVQDRREQ